MYCAVVEGLCPVGTQVQRDKFGLANRLRVYSTR